MSLLERQLEMATVVWLTNNISHYHRARADAFAREWPGSFTILQLANRDALPVLESKACEFARTVTLFPGTTIDKVPNLRLRNSLLRSLEEIRPDVCCLNGWGLPGTAAMLHWALRRGAPCVLMSDSNEHDAPRAWWKDAIKRCLVTQCGAALVAGSWSREYAIRLGMSPESIFDGYDVVDNDHFRTGALSARTSRDRALVSLGLPKNYFLACARFEPVKNLHRLIEGYAAYVREIGSEPWSLVLAGDGPLRRDLESLAEGLGVRERLTFKGLVPYQDLPGTYALAKALVHPSTKDTWGLVVNEAMASGLPVLVSERCGCSKDLVSHQVNGLLFNPWRTEEITSVMLTAHRESSRLEQMGRESSAIIAQWGPERFAGNLRKGIDYSRRSKSRRPHPISKAVVWAMTYRYWATTYR
jgi:glycosyltransferase involved in cell wall biosynthesis